MKATGIVRRIDDLGRVVIPKEIRRTLRLREGTPLEIFTDREGEIILKKYSPMMELNAFAGQYADAMAQATGLMVCITDREIPHDKPYGFCYTDIRMPGQKVFAPGGISMEPEDIMYTFDDLKQILEKLRDKENGCPWDSVQTHESMKKYLVEECGEVLEAIDNQDTENLCEELGDVLYQIMIHCEIEKEQGNFTIDDVVNGICEKMVRRHPRLFGGEMEKDLTWEEIKKREKEARAARKNR